jgi:3-demethoxyubiquinol 3-hydroxylase
MDTFLIAFDNALRTLFAQPHASTPSPASAIEQPELSLEEKKHSGALMRVNHVGEVCAQALYSAQASMTQDPALRSHLWAAAREETDHLAWTQDRLNALGARPSILNPLWFTGAFIVGVIAAKISDKVSLGFVEETEKQVSAHLHSHLHQLPVDDHASRAVVTKMQADEERHAEQAKTAGALPLPAPAKTAMKIAAKMMTKTAYYL